MAYGAGLFSWKLSVAFFVLVGGSAVIVGRGQTATSKATAVVVILVTLGLLVFFVPMWRTQIDHDARLDKFVEQLCSVDVGTDGSIEDCGGYISNTGNGNSCEYTAWAVVEGSTGTEVFQRSYRPAYPGAPPASGPTINGPSFEDVEGGFKVTISQGWTPEEDDPRCQ